MKLSEIEINQVLEKIKTKYTMLINDFKKPVSILKSFEERYLSVLKSRQDISSFLMGEIKAIDSYYKKEDEKRKSDEEERLKREKILKEKSFADKIMEENSKRILKYNKVSIDNNASEEIEHLFGAVRDFIINYFPALTQIYRDDIHHSIKNYINNFYHNLLSKFDYKNEVPIARAYIYSLKKVPLDNKKTEVEFYFILKESAFLLNEIYDFLKSLLNNNKIPEADVKLYFQNSNYSKTFNENFKDLTNKEAFLKIFNFLENIILDFRIKDIKKK